MNVVVCLKCKHLENIDTHGEIDCKLNIHGKAKIYCKHFTEDKKTRS